MRVNKLLGAPLIALGLLAAAGAVACLVLLRDREGEVANLLAFWLILLTFLAGIWLMMGFRVWTGAIPLPRGPRLAMAVTMGLLGLFFLLIPFVSPIDGALAGFLSAACAGACYAALSLGTGGGRAG